MISNKLQMNHVASGSSDISLFFLPIISRLLKFSYFFRKIIDIERHFVIGFKCTKGADASVFIAVGGWRREKKRDFRNNTADCL